MEGQRKQFLEQKLDRQEMIRRERGEEKEREPQGYAGKEMVKKKPLTRILIPPGLHLTLLTLEEP